MSIIFGLRTRDQAPVEECRLRHLAAATRNFAPDGTFVTGNEGVGMGFQPYHTHARSTLELQPNIDKLGNILCLDGRLDNHEDLRNTLCLNHEIVPDSAVALAAFARWGENCFAHFVGDWALALWSRADRSLYLARDHAGTRTLFYEFDQDRVLWSTYLETFFVERNSRRLCQAFSIRYLSFHPLGTFTPYEGINAVPASHYVHIRGDQFVIRSHWQPLIHETIHYQDNRDYDERFKEILTTAVKRRTGVEDPAVAELSGGMDSTSIVCISDRIRKALGSGPDGLLDTLSYYDDGESTWDEQPYFSATEAQRGKVGIHISLPSTDRTFHSDSSAGTNQLWPGGDASSQARAAALDLILKQRGFRAIVSGVGGDEILGGLPDPRPELADAMFEGEFARLFVRAIEWAIARREPLAFILWDAFAFAARPYLCSRSAHETLPPWILGIAVNDPAAVPVPPIQDQLFRFVRPSSIGNSIVWWHLLESLPNRHPASRTRCEYRYPLLDRDFVEFVFKIPRDQIQKPGRRRNLHRRALAGIVPALILERRRKAFKQHGSLLSLRNARGRLVELFRRSSLEQHQFINPDKVVDAINQVVSGRAPQWRHALIRTIDFELWLNSTHAIT